MRYQSFFPSPALNDLVRNYTVINFNFDKHQTIPVKQRSPKAEQKIVFYIKGSVTLSNTKTEKKDTPPPVTLFTHQLDQKSFQVTREFFALVIYLKPGALYRLMRLPMTEFDVDYFDAELFFGSEVKRVSEQLAESTSVAHMIAIAERFLLAKSKHLESDSVVDMIAIQVLEDPASFALDRMAHDACLSTKQFYRKFVQRIGISPKYFSRLSRFNHAWQYKLMHPNVSWSSIAQEFAYTDYHHMEKEFKEFLGHTPGEWVKAELAAPERILKLR
jgi:AraC-like DNA-binding protein